MENETTYVAPTISTCGGGNTEPKVFDRGYVRKLLMSCSAFLDNFSNWHTIRR